MAEPDLFAEYLRCGLPGGYPNKDIALGPEMSPEMKQALIEQQALFLAEADARVGAEPALAYIAAMKHFGLMQVLEITAETFPEGPDRDGFHELEDRGLHSVETAQAALDEDTAFYCDRLVAIQAFSQMLLESRILLAQMLEAGAKALGPELPPPKPGFLGIFKKKTGGAEEPQRVLRKNFNALAATFELDPEKLGLDLEYAHTKIDGFLRERTTLEMKYL